MATSFTHPGKNQWQLFPPPFDVDVNKLGDSPRGRTALQEQAGGQTDRHTDRRPEDTPSDRHRHTYTMQPAPCKARPGLGTTVRCWPWRRAPQPGSQDLPASAWGLYTPSHPVPSPPVLSARAGTPPPDARHTGSPDAATDAEARTPDCEHDRCPRPGSGSDPADTHRAPRIPPPPPAPALPSLGGLQVAAARSAARTAEHAQSRPEGRGPGQPRPQPTRDCASRGDRRDSERPGNLNPGLRVPENGASGRAESGQPAAPTVDGRRSVFLHPVYTLSILRTAEARVEAKGGAPRCQALHTWPRGSVGIGETARCWNPLCSLSTQRDVTSPPTVSQ